MRKILFVIYSCVCCTLFAQTNSDIQSVLNNMNAQEQSWNKGDIPAFMQHYWKSDSLKFIGGKGITYGWQKTLDNYLKVYPDKVKMGTLKFTIIETTQLSETSMYVVGEWELQKEKPTGGHFTLLWKKINGVWVIVSDHTS
ncbi:MAG: nuclear transport factor 2 family protein [Bacteroidetes bacterium]|nr:nuclear transport factor 2 family protein [Bacteroidota bacterium]